MLEPPPFRSVEEAMDFLVNHEIATNNKYVIKSSKNFTSTISLPSLEHRRIRWEFVLDSSVHYDGIPYAIMGVKTNMCQYGFDYKQSRLKYNPAGFKQRRRAHSKKVNCPGNTKMTMVMKFPEYAVPLDSSETVKRRMSTRLRTEFCEETQRYVLVFLRINANHDHGVEHILLNNLTNKEVSRSLLRNATVATLKPGATLKGKNMAGLITQFNCTNEMPACPAQPCLSQSLDQMGINEMLALFCELTGGTPNSVFSAAQKEFNEDNLRLLLHLCIVFANAEAENSTQRVAHQSVRISGTENSFVPVTCFDATCPAALDETHMHCPFCSKSEGFTDIAVLKLHYNDRHVGKAIEYGGLKILRCLGECASKSIVKDIKIYLHGHWHCWRCGKLYNKKSGFMRHVQNHVMNGVSNRVQLDKNYYAMSNPHTVWHDVKTSKSATTVGAELNISNVADDDPVYKVSSCGTSRTLVEPDYTFAHSTEEVLQPEYDRAVLYIQGENDQIVYTSESHDNPGEVVIHMSENETEHLHQRLRELEHKCMELEHENMAYKSHIQFLNKKIEELTVAKQLERENTSSPDGSHEMEIADSPAEEPTLQTQGEAVPKSKSKVPEDKTKAALLQSLEELRTKHPKKEVEDTPPDSETVPPNTVSAISAELLQIKTDVEQLKMALVIGSQMKQASATYVPSTVNPVYVGNYGLSVIPQNFILNASNIATSATGKQTVGNVLDKDDSKSTNKHSSEKNTSVETDNAKPGKSVGEEDLPSSSVAGEVEIKKEIETTIDASGKDISSNEITDTNDDNDDANVEMTDADEDDKEVLMSEKHGLTENAVTVNSEAGNMLACSLPIQSNVMIPIGIAPTGKIVTYLHMPPTKPLVLGSPDQGQNETTKPSMLGTEDEGQKVSSKTLVFGSGDQGQKEPTTKTLDKTDATAQIESNLSSVVLAVVNDSVSGGKKVVSLVQISEDEATLSIPFEYKCFQKEKILKDDGTYTEVKKECVKNQIKLKVKGNVKALQGESLQKIVDSALSRFVVVNPPPSKKLKLN